MTDTTIVKLNNRIWELEKENGQLKKDCSNLIDDNTEYVAEINQMHKENEQLQKKNDNLVHMIARVQYRADTIKDENKQLKADKQSLIEFIKKEFPKSHKHILEGFE